MRNRAPRLEEEKMRRAREPAAAVVAAEAAAEAAEAEVIAKRGNRSVSINEK